MTATSTNATVTLDRAVVQQRMDELLAQVRDCQAVLRYIDQQYAPTELAKPEHAALTNGKADVAPNGARHKRLSEKREAILTILREHGERRWTTAAIRDELVERGVDPQAGTPVKNIMWHLAKGGTVTASGGGVYMYPAIKPGGDAENQEAIRV